MVKNSGKKVYNQKGFFENIKDVGVGVVDGAVKDVIGGTIREAAEQIKGTKTNSVVNNGTLEERRPFDFEQYINQREQVARQEEQFFYARKRAEEKIVWSAEQQKNVLQINQIQKELKRVMQQTQGLHQEINRVALEELVEPGVYHLNFLQRIWEVVKLIRKKIQESKNWLAEWQTYCRKKRNYYWAQVQTSGTKYMLSSERYMSTQAG